MIFLVFAGNYGEFVQWRIDHPNLAMQARYCDSIRSIAGCGGNVRIVLYGTYLVNWQVMDALRYTEDRLRDRGELEQAFLEDWIEPEIRRDGEEFTGTVTRARITDHSLSSAEIRSLMRHGTVVRRETIDGWRRERTDEGVWEEEYSNSPYAWGSGEALQPRLIDPLDFGIVGLDGGTTKIFPTPKNEERLHCKCHCHHKVKCKCIRKCKHCEDTIS